MKQYERDFQSNKMVDEQVLACFLHADYLLRGRTVWSLFVAVCFSLDPSKAGYQILAKSCRFANSQEEALVALDGVIYESQDISLQSIASALQECKCMPITHPDSS